MAPAVTKVPLAAVVHPHTRLWATPTVRAARAMLTRYYQSGWLVSVSLVGVALGLLLFWRPGGATYIFTTAQFAYGLLAFATAALLTRALSMDTPANSDASAGERITRLRALALAMGALQVGALVLLLTALLLFGRVRETDAGAFLAGTLGLITNCVTLGVVVALLLAVTTQTRWIAVLAWLVAALWSYSTHGALHAALLIARLPLLPLGTLYNAGASGEFGWRAALALVCEAGYIAFALWLTPRMAQRPVAVAAPSAVTRQG
ncbi:MAG: hypothetical protein ACRDHE_06925 [Ktedonobacterales bacterium]